MKTSCLIKNVIRFLPTIGILIFVGLYLYSSFLYLNSITVQAGNNGSSWMNYYLCNLMSNYRLDNQINPARPFAITGTIVLCVSLMIFFVQFSRRFASNQYWRLAIPINGIIAMGFGMFVFTDFHDLMTTLSSLFGVIAVLGIIWEVYISELYLFKWSGLFCVLLLIINNYIYYSNQLIDYLPLLQKITILVVLIWVVGLNFKMAVNTNT